MTARRPTPTPELRADKAEAPGAKRLSLAGERGARSWQPAPRPWWKNLLGTRGAQAQAVLEAL